MSTGLFQAQRRPITVDGDLGDRRKAEGRRQRCNNVATRYGRFLLADALFRAVRSEIASFAVVVDANDEAARRFYGRESFLPLSDSVGKVGLRLFRPMADIAKLYE
jgi:hypothetical protein